MNFHLGLIYYIFWFSHFIFFSAKRKQTDRQIRFHKPIDSPSTQSKYIRAITYIYITRLFVQKEGWENVTPKNMILAHSSSTSEHRAQIINRHLTTPFLPRHPWYTNRYIHYNETFDRYTHYTVSIMTACYGQLEHL